MDYTLIRSTRKTLSLSLREDGSLLVRAPRLVSIHKIEEFINSKQAWIEKKRALLAERQRNHPQKTKEEIQEQIAQGYAILSPLVEEYAAQMNVRPTALSITKAEKRFGSCSSGGHICFSYRLVEYPEDAIRYVIIHELAHMKELNHSPRFWAIVKQFCPDYKNCQKLLLK